LRKQLLSIASEPLPGTYLGILINRYSSFRTGSLNYYSISVKNFSRKLAFDFSASSFEVQFGSRAAVSARKRIRCMGFVVPH